MIPDASDDSPAAPRPYVDAARRFLAGARANIVQQVVLIAGHLVLVPLFISHWGDEAYGSWLLLVALSGWLTLCDLGLTTSALNSIADAAARGNQDQLAQRTRSTLRATAVIAAFVVAAAAGLSAIAARHPILQMPGTDAGETAFSILLLGIAVAAAFPQGVLAGLYRAVGEYARGVTVQTALRATTLTATAATVVLGGDMLAIAAIHAIVACIFLVGTTADLRRRHPDLPVGVAAGDLRYATRFIRPGLLFLAIQAAAMLSIQGSAILVGSICGAATLAVFGAMRTLSNFCRQVFGNLGIALWSETTVLAATRDRAALSAVHRIFGRVMIAVSFSIIAVLAACGDELFLTWTQGALPFDRLLFIALLVHLAQQAYWSTSATILLSWNRHRPVAAFQTAASLVGLIVGGLLMPRFGPAGLIFSLAGAEAALCGVFLPISADRSIAELPRRDERHSDLPFHLDLLPGILPMALVSFGTAISIADFLGTGNALVRWSVVAITTSTATLAATLVWLSPGDRALVRGVIASRVSTWRLSIGGGTR